MELLRLALRNTLRHPVRSLLTALGIGVALFAFTLIRTLIGAWYSGVEASAKNRLVVRNAVSLVFSLPETYGTTIAKVPGVARVGHGNWFGGIYKDERFRFQQFAIDDEYLDVYPELLIDPADRTEWDRERRGTLVGAALAESLGIKKGDVIQLKGTIFPGLWELSVSGIFRGREPETDTRLMFFHYDYLNERNRSEMQRDPDTVGFYVVQLAPGADPATVASAIDASFANSYAETLSETETAFIQGFISMSSAIITILRVVAYVVVVIMLLVLANTTLLSFRERSREYAIMKSLGFTPRNLAGLILMEAALLTGAGLVVLSLLLAPVMVLPPRKLLGDLLNFFPVFAVSWSTLGLVVLFAAIVTVLASSAPIVNVVRMRIAEGLRQI